MCLIVYKKREVEMPSVDLVNQWWAYNSSGAGVAWKRAGSNQVHFEKGLMTKEDFQNFIFFNDFQVEDLVVFHFRRGSSGAVDKDNCHPFNLDHLYEVGGASVEALAFSSGRMFAAEGKSGSGLVLAKRFLAPFFGGGGIRSGSEDLLRVTFRASRIKALLVLRGKVLRFGRFFEIEDGLLVSNLRYLRIETNIKRLQL